MSGFCKKASFSSGLKSPDCLKLFSTIMDISEPRSFTFNFFSNSVIDFLSEDNGDIATGRGLKFPLVISTSIKA